MSFFDKIKSGLNSIVSSAERSLESSPCEICEKQLSFYEKKHLADGFICGACFEKASPYFIQKHKKQKATVEQFKAHLHDRQKNAAAFGISAIEYQGCEYIKFKLERGDGATLMERIEEDVRTHGIEAESLVSPTEAPSYDKYDEYVPPSLLRLAYVRDRLNVDDALESLVRTCMEYTTCNEDQNNATK